MATKKRNMQSVEPRFITWETIGERAEGTLENVDTFTYRNGDQGVRYTLVSDGGDLMQFNGTTQLNTLMGTIPIGVYVEIEYIELVQTNQLQPAKIFSVMREIDAT